MLSMRPLEHRLSRCQCPAGLWVGLQTKRCCKPNFMGWQRRMLLLDVTNKRDLYENQHGFQRLKFSYLSIPWDMRRKDEEWMIMNLIERLIIVEQECVSQAAAQLRMKWCHVHHNCMQNRCFPCYFTSYEFKWCVISIKKAVRNCVIYMVWELPRSLQPFSSTNMRTAGSNSMKRSSTFPRLSHLTSTCVATSEYSPWSSFTNERSSVFRNEAPFATIMLTVWVRNPSSLWALHLFVCCTVVRDAKYEKFGIWGSFVSKAITPFSYHGRSSPIGSPGKQPSVDGFGWSMKKPR